MSTSIEVKNIGKLHSKTVPLLVTELLWCLETIFLYFVTWPLFNFMLDSGVSRKSTRRSRANWLYFSARYATRKVRSWSLCRFRSSHSGNHGFSWRRRTPNLAVNLVPLVLNLVLLPRRILNLVVNLVPVVLNLVLLPTVGTLHNCT